MSARDVHRQSVGQPGRAHLRPQRARSGWRGGRCGATRARGSTASVCAAAASSRRSMPPATAGPRCRARPGDGHHRRPSRLGAERRLARRHLGVLAAFEALRMLPGSHAAGDPAARRLGRRGRRALRPKPARIVGGERKPRRRRGRGLATTGHEARRRAGRERRRRSIACSTRIGARSASTRAHISSCTSSGAGARSDEQADRRRARHVRRRAAHAAVRRSGGAFGFDADSDAARCVSRGGAKARSPAARSRGATRRRRARRLHGRAS